jgi:hypothetical protein
VTGRYLSTRKSGKGAGSARLDGDPGSLAAHRVQIRSLQGIMSLSVTISWKQESHFLLLLRHQQYHTCYKPEVQYQYLKIGRSLEKMLKVLRAEQAFLQPQNRIAT